MEKSKHLIVQAIIFIILSGCCWVKDDIENEDDVISPQLAECTFSADTMDWSFGIEFDKPDLYLIPGEQSDLSDSNFFDLHNALGDIESNLYDIQKVCHWINQNFQFENAGGNMIGIPTVDELYAARVFYGCHSLSLIISSSLRSYGIPTVMIETAGVQWAYDYRDSKTSSFSGHVMTEVYVAGEWILLDNDCSAVEDYDPANPFISMQAWNPDDYFIYAKGRDTWEYSEKEDGFTHRKMEEFSEYVHCYEEMFFTVNYAWTD